MKRLSPATAYVLKALLPYTRPNLLLVFTPALFFAELTKHSKYKKSTLQSAYYRSIQRGLVELDLRRTPSLSTHAKVLLQMNEPRKFKAGECLIVAFDVPENKRYKRDYIRTLLRELNFEQIQKSVWLSRYRHTDFIIDECLEQGLGDYVCIFEARRLPIKAKK